MRSKGDTMKKETNWNLFDACLILSMILLIMKLLGVIKVSWLAIFSPIVIILVVWVITIILMALLSRENR